MALPANRRGQRRTGHGPREGILYFLYTQAGQNARGYMVSPRRASILAIGAPGVARTKGFCIFYTVGGSTAGS